MSQAVELVLSADGDRRPVIIAGDFNAGAGASELFDTVLVRNGRALSLRVDGTHEALTEPVLLETGARVPLSDHAAIVVELTLAPCPSCPPPPRPHDADRDAVLAALASDATPGRMAIALGAAAGVSGLAFLWWRRARRWRTTRSPVVRALGLAMLGAGVVWTAYLGAFCYPARGRALARIAAELEAHRDARVGSRQRTPLRIDDRQ